jgi:predicted unusual protein kinase regulating ubiquinone biosynthesis (AarF/ABC1/UbiB family)
MACRFVHCDPHFANMMVRKDSKGRPQLVLLDHGLYKQIEDDLRLEYAALWQALIFGDEQVPPPPPLPPRKQDPECPPHGGNC